MTPHSLQTLISNGEDTCHQFKRDFNRIDGLATEQLAFATATGAKQIIERCLKQLKDQQTINFRGAPKTGDYYLRNKKAG